MCRKACLEKYWSHNMIKYAGTNSYSVSFIHVHYIFGSRPADTLYVACNAFHCALAQKKSDTLKRRKKNINEENAQTTTSKPRANEWKSVFTLFCLANKWIFHLLPTTHMTVIIINLSQWIFDSTTQAQNIPSAKTYNSFGINRRILTRLFISYSKIVLHTIFFSSTRSNARTLIRWIVRINDILRLLFLSCFRWCSFLY